MNFMYHAWCVQIDITTACPEACVYCTRFIRHLRPDQRAHMTVEQFDQALASLEGWPTEIGVIGGEPLLHPRLSELNALIRQRVPQHKVHLFTALASRPSGNAHNQASPNPDSCYHWHESYVWSRWPGDDADIANTYGTVRYNPHTKEKASICRHHPSTVAVGEAVADKALVWKLINNCYVPRMWSPTINRHGAYFCEVAAFLDMALYDGSHAWAVVPGWWKRGPEYFQEQVGELCIHCGMCLPMERQYVSTEKEQMTPGLRMLLEKNNQRRLSARDVDIVRPQFSSADIIRTNETWFPANYRDDLLSDDEVPEHWRGILVPLTHADDDPDIYPVATEEEFECSLASVTKIPFYLSTNGEFPSFRFLHKGVAFDPLTEQYPFVLKGNDEGNQVFRRAMLLYFRYLLDDEDFSVLKDESNTWGKIIALPAAFRRLLKEKQEIWLREEGERLAGREVLFWGCGAAYKAYGRFFSAARPVRILLTGDTGGLPGSVDGIPVSNAEEFFRKSTISPLPYVVFARKAHMPLFSGLIRDNYAHYCDGSVTLCQLDDPALEFEG